MSDLWGKYKSYIRNPLQRYYGPDVIAYIHGMIQIIEPGGFVEAFKQHKINLAHLFPLLRWSFIYGNKSRKYSKPFTKIEFTQLYNGMIELGQREVPRELASSVRINCILRETARNQLAFQTDPLRMFSVFATIMLKYCDKQGTNKLAKSFGFIDIDEFILAHYLISVYPVLRKEYVRDCVHFSTLADPMFLRRYIDEFILNANDYSLLLQKVHDENKAKNAIWKEIDDMNWFACNPMVKFDAKILVLSLTGLAHYSSYGFLSKLSTEQKWFYQDSFANGFESYVSNLLMSNGKSVISEEQIMKLLSSTGKTPDALVEADDRAVFIEFKSNKPPRFAFESFDQESIQGSVKSSVYKGMTQIFNAMKLYKKKFPAKEVRGVVLTLYEFHCGIPSVFAQEVLSQFEMSEYSELIDSFGICSLHDFLPIAELSQTEFVDDLFKKIGQPNFYLLGNTKWKNSDSKELSETLGYITNLAADRFQV